MDKTSALQNLLNGTATEEEIQLLKHGLVSGEISIGGNVNLPIESESTSMPMENIRVFFFNMSLTMMV